MTARPSPPAPHGDAGVNPSTEPRFGDVASRLLSRRSAWQGLFTAAALGGMGALASRQGALAQGTTITNRSTSRSTLGFTEVSPGPGPDHAVAPGYKAQVLIRWGDAVLAGAPAFNPLTQSAASQSRQFGYNNDFLAFLPLPQGTAGSDHGLLWANHEYTEPHMMFPGLNEKDSFDRATQTTVDVELAALGGSIVEVRKAAAGWEVVAASRYARRITPADTPMTIAGPAAGHRRMRTSADPSGTMVIGMLANCSGGVTPWGTVLSGEENIHGAFSGDGAQTTEARNFKRYGFVPKSYGAFGRFYDRFDMAKELHEANRFGWIVEIDPYDPASTPVKRTALGRFKHEAATVWVNPNGTVTVYSGDDERNEYLYKFVSGGKYNPVDRAANRTLLDDGTLYAAQFTDDGMVKWFPLTFGQGPLTAANGFASQADVLIETRRAADLLQATPMDRPEDVETNPVTGRAYVVLTNNNRRKPEDVNKANPRANNQYGHIIELLLPGDGKAADHSVTEHAWDMFLIGGPADQGGKSGASPSAAGWLACPDNITFDNAGRIWIATDQGGSQAKFGIGDGMWAADTTGPGRATVRFFYRVPTGAEMTGPCFTPDNRTLFVAVQHPAADDEGSSFDKPSTRWPDFRADMPPRSSVVAITKEDGGLIGS